MLVFIHIFNFLLYNKSYAILHNGWLLNPFLKSIETFQKFSNKKILKPRRNILIVELPQQRGDFRFLEFPLLATRQRIRGCGLHLPRRPVIEQRWGGDALSGRVRRFGRGVSPGVDRVGR